MPKSSCPICLENFFDVDQSGQVCRPHLRWLVVTCRSCGRVGFSNHAGECMACAGIEVSHPMSVGSPNRVSYLIIIGQEGRSMGGFW